MSSASSGRYQSRLFNFVHKQSRRFKRQCDRALEQLQATANWAVAVGLSPLLLIFQSARSTAKQMHQAGQQNFSQLPVPDLDAQPKIPPTVDTPIQRVLLLVDALSSGDRKIRKSEVRSRKSEVEITTHDSRLTTHSIRGIATHLSSRALVLVTAQNEILDILSAQQQQQLQQQIIAAIADYWRYQRLAHSIKSAEVKVLRTELPTEDPHSVLSPQSSLLSKPPTTRPVLAFLDRKVAEVESKQLVHVSEVAKSSLSLAQAVSQSSRQLVGRLKAQFDVALFRGKSPAMSPSVDSATSTNRIQALIWAAIDYFFGVGDRERQQLAHSTANSHTSQSSPIQNLVGIPDLPLEKSLKSTAAPSPAKRLTGRRLAAKLFSAPLSSAQLPPGSQSVTANIEDPWLTLNDLFGDSGTASGTATDDRSKQSRSRTISSGTQKPSLALPANEAAGYFLQNFVRSWQKFWSKPKPGSELVKRQKVAKGKVVGKDGQKQAAPLSKSPRQAKASEICDRTGNQSTHMEPKPDWIETHATMMGYVKHPLEQLLAWLDQAMLWLEELCIKIWRWLRQLSG